MSNAQPEYVFLDEGVDPSCVYEHRDFAENMLRVVVAGRAGSGKTSFLERVCFDTFSKQRATINFDFAIKRLWCSNGRRVKVQMVDLAGDERNWCASFSGMMSDASVFLLVMPCVDSEEEYTQLLRWKYSLEQIARRSNLTVAVLCSKIDLIESEELLEQLQDRIELRLQDVMRINGGIHFVSAKTGWMCQESLYKIAMRAMDLGGAQTPQKPTVVLESSTALTNKKKCCK